MERGRERECAQGDNRGSDMHNGVQTRSGTDESQPKPVPDSEGVGGKLALIHRKRCFGLGRGCRMLAGMGLSMVVMERSTRERVR